MLGISIPVWVALLAWPILGERLSPLRAVSLMVALAGIAVLIGGHGLEASFAKLPGFLCVLAGAICVALGTVLTKHFPLAMPPLSLAAWQIGLGCLPVAMVGLALEQPQLAALSAVGWASMLYMTLIQFCLCYVCWFAALERLPAATASIGTLLVPVIGVLSAGAMLHEPLGWREITALVVTLGGVTVALRGGRRRFVRRPGPTGDGGGGGDGGRRGGPKEGGSEGSKGVGARAHQGSRAASFRALVGGRQGWEGELRDEDGVGGVGWGCPRADLNWTIRPAGGISTPVFSNRPRL